MMKGKECIRERNMARYFLPMGPVILTSINELHVLAKLEEESPSHVDELDLGFVPGVGEEEEEEPTPYSLLYRKCQALGVCLI